MVGVHTVAAGTIAKNVGEREYASMVGYEDFANSAEGGHFASTAVFAGRAKTAVVRVSVSIDASVTSARNVVERECVNTVEGAICASIAEEMPSAFTGG
uniref:Uncharacterized protein n=1 Tax=Chromera velia CCMP2878 TaxID=1169474 RepID=A0A0G4IDJ1_9ALVE|eukprot:Cvel_2351.t1-p1 / transcript=Cvel_2351.t1 / gene=Cvel_2351 / organism=Chromera_velia_CCMP2878 / gene_product=Zinc finger protein 850, putative / transcript_product=Zinc finger protein 850, putative / location=Cvel_scaffold91:42530-42823(-) / protein_length=98 / sequence_SO=supercontig / SO=protein_coding / is_pseudo=false